MQFRCHLIQRTAHLVVSSSCYIVHVVILIQSHALLEHSVPGLTKIPPPHDYLSCSCLVTHGPSPPCLGATTYTHCTGRYLPIQPPIQASSKKGPSTDNQLGWYLEADMAFYLHILGQAPAQLSSHHARPFCFTYSLSASTILDGSFHIVAPQRLCFADSFQVPCLLPISR